MQLSGAGLPYAPFAAALRELVRERGAAEVAALLPGQGAAELAALLPEFGALPSGADPETARARLFELLRALLEALAEQQPVVLVVEDVHWADRPTCDLLSFLVRNLRQAAVLLVVTFRSDSLHRTHPLRALLAGLERMDGVTRLELPRLSRDQVAAQLEGILGHPAAPSLGSEGAVAIQVARHWRGAREVERALIAAWRAAAAAGVAFAYAEQLMMLEQVLELWDQVDDPARHAGADRLSVLMLAADAARWAGEPERGLALVEAALAGLGEAGDAAVQRASLLRRRAGLLQELLLPRQIDDLQAALALAGDPTLLRAQTLAQLCWALKREDRCEEAEQLASELRDLADRLGDQEHQAEAVMALAALRALKGEDTVAALHSAREAAARAGSGRLEAWAYLTITDVLERRGDHERAVAAGREGLARARQLGLTRQIAAPIAGNLAESLASTGSWDEALEILDEVLCQDLPALGRFAPLMVRGQIALARGEREAAARTLADLRSLPIGVHAESQRTLALTELQIDCQLADGDLIGALATVALVPAFNLDADPRYSWPLLAAAMRACADASAAGLTRGADGLPRLRETLTARAVRIARRSPVQKARAVTVAAEA